MEQKAHRRFALAVVDNLEEALTAIRQLIRSDLEPQIISVVGQEASFAGERKTTVELGRIVSRQGQAPNLMIDSNRIISLARGAGILPKSVSGNSEAFGRKLRQWLSPEHAERLTKAIACGEFLLRVELHSMVEERIATRILLRHCRGSVEVHDFDVAESTEEFHLDRKRPDDDED